MKIGLTSDEVKTILEITKKFTHVEKVILFGSRAMNNHKVGSDVDIAIVGSCKDNEISEIKYRLEENTTMPYFFDVVLMNTIDNPKFIEHIEKYGVELMGTVTK